MLVIFLDVVVAFVLKALVDVELALMPLLEVGFGFVLIGLLVAGVLASAAVLLIYVGARAIDEGSCVGGCAIPVAALLVLLAGLSIYLTLRTWDAMNHHSP